MSEEKKVRQPIMKKDPEIKKSWNFRVTQPAIVLAKLNLETLPETLSCGCSCFECRSNYQGNSSNYYYSNYSNYYSN